MDLNTLKEDNQLHDLNHESDIDPNRLLGKDISCQICYPLFTPEPDNFKDFWYWYQIQFRDIDILDLLLIYSEF